MGGQLWKKTRFSGREKMIDNRTNRIKEEI